MSATYNVTLTRSLTRTPKARSKPNDPMLTLNTNLISLNPTSNRGGQMSGGKCPDAGSSDTGRRRKLIVVIISSSSSSSSGSSSNSSSGGGGGGGGSGTGVGELKIKYPTGEYAISPQPVV